MHQGDQKWTSPVILLWINWHFWKLFGHFSLVTLNGTIHGRKLSSFFPFLYLQVSVTTQLNRQNRHVKSLRPGSPPLLPTCTDSLSVFLSSFGRGPHVIGHLGGLSWCNVDKHSQLPKSLKNLSLIILESTYNIHISITKNYRGDCRI